MWEKKKRKPANFLWKFWAYALVSNEKYIFQNLTLLQVFRGPVHSHLPPSGFWGAEAGGTVTPEPSFSGGAQLRLRSRFWAQRLNQVQKRGLIPRAAGLEWGWGCGYKLLLASCLHRRCGCVFSNSCHCPSLESRCIFLLTCPESIIFHVWLKPNCLLSPVLTIARRVWVLLNGWWCFK